ncbi:bifunctional diguanylate cyclase/phosphodiesterase [Flavimaricola marinus]|nr:EAL domain-containing protein [Flavimaricola marinus]
MGTDQCKKFDAITQLASRILGCPIALVSLVDERQQWFKSNTGLDVRSTPRDVAFCAHAIVDQVPLIVPDARLDDRFRSNPLVIGHPNIVFYAGIPLSVDGEHNLGTLCAIDNKPRTLSRDEVEQLSQLAKLAEALIAAHYEQRELELSRAAEANKRDALERSVTLLEQVKELSGVGGWELRLNPTSLAWTNETKRIHEVDEDYEPQLDTAIDFYAPESRDIIRACVNDAIEKGTPWDVELPLITALGRRVWVRTMGRPVYQDDHMVSLIGAFQDITRTTEAHAKVVASEEFARLRSEQFQTVIDNMDEGVSVFDHNACITMWNRRYIDVFRKPEGEVKLGTSLKQLLECEQERGEFEGDIDQHLDELIAKLSTGSAQTFQFRTRDGTIVQSTHAPLPGGGWVGTHSDVTARVIAAERDEYAARHDALTGLANSLEFHNQLNELANVDRNERAIVLLLIDLDRFKEINDTYGHQAGDDLLKEVAKRLKECTRECDLVARLGGDEFAFLTKCKHANAKSHAIAIARRINESVRRPFAVASSQEIIGASVGICVSDDPNLEPDELIGRADRALYKVKSSGRGSFYYHDDILDAEELKKRRLASEVRSAVQDSSLALAFQPIYDLKKLEFCGAEALIRWGNPQTPELQPNDLIRIAEETGAINEIGTWVLNESLSRARAWPDDLTLSVNVSPSQLGRGVFRDLVAASLSHHNVAPERLELEITEQVLIKDENNTIAELKEIQATGVRIVLDDFGTGYASLSYLQKFPFDKIKVDRSFVSGDSLGAQSRAIVSSIATLARELGIPCTVEGVESQQKLDQIVALGCDFAQGFYLSEPIKAEAFHFQKELMFFVA